LSIGLFAQAENYRSKLYKIKEAEDEANRTCNHKEKKETWQEGIGNSR
jgi:hypothetical protein